RELTGVICDKLIPLCLNFMPSSIPHNGAYSCLLRVRMQIFNETDHAFQCMEMMMLRWSMGLILHDRVRNSSWPLPSTTNLGQNGRVQIPMVWTLSIGQPREKQCTKHRSHSPRSHYPWTKTPRPPKAKMDRQRESEHFG